MNLDQIFRQAIESKASDIHFATGEVPRFRIDGQLVPADTMPISQEQLSDMLDPVFSIEAQAQVRSGVQVSRTTLVGGIVFIGIAYRAGEDGLMVTFRLLNNEIAPLEKIGFDALELLEEITKMRRGLIVISGPTLSGKWTTTCAMIEHINLHSASRIFVVSGPANFIFKSKQAMITELQVGRECQTYTQAMQVAHDADLDVIAVDDLPTEEAVREALLLADTGHLVIANLHAIDSSDALRILMRLGVGNRTDYFDALAANLVAITGQRLFPKSDAPGRAAAYNWLKVDRKLRDLIRKGDIESLKEFRPDPTFGRTREEGIQSLLQQGLIDEKTALNALRHEDFRFGQSSFDSTEEIEA